MIAPKELDIIAQRFSSKEGFNAQMSRFAFRRMKPFFKGRTCLEVGCSDGAMTPSLLEHFEFVVAIDGSPVQIKRLKETVESQSSDHHLEAYAVLAEDFKYKYLQFDTIVCSYIFEHVADPQKLLIHLKTFLAPGGVIIVVVPNAWSIHRTVAVEAGLINDHIFHLGSGYITWLYWDSFNKDGSINPLCNVAPSFVSPEYSFQSLHYGIMKTLCDVFGTLNQKKQLEKNMKRLLTIFGKEPSCLKNSEEITKQYFYQAAEQYLE